MSLCPRAAVLPVLLLCALASSIQGEPPAATGTDRYRDALPPGAVARLGSVRLRHDSAPALVAFSADGKMLAVLTCRQGNTLWRWKVATGEKVGRLPIATEAAGAAAFSPTGRFLALCSGERLELVDATTGKVSQPLEFPGQRITSLAVSPDGKLLAAGCAANRLDEPSDVVLWETAGGKELARLRGHKTAVDPVAFSSDGRRLLSSSQEHTGLAGTRFPETIPGTLCIWDVAGRKLRRQVPQKGVNVVFAPDGKSMACSDKEGAIHLWDLETERERAKLDGDWRSYLFSPDSKTLVTGSRHEMLTEWDAAAGKKLRTFAGHLGRGVFPAAFSPDGKMLATVGNPMQGDTSVRLWEMATGKEHHPFAGHRDRVSCLAFAPDGKTLISGSKDGTLRVWDAETGKERRVYAGHHAAITALALSPDGKTAASGDERNMVHLWSPANDEPLHRLEAHPGRGQRTGVRCLAFTADGKTLLAGSMALDTEAAPLMHGLLAAWDVASGKQVQARKEEGSCPVALTEDGRFLASNALKGQNLFAPQEALLLRRRDVDRALARIEGGEGCMFPAVIFSADGKVLATQSQEQQGGLFGGGSRTTRAKLWEAATGKVIATLARAGHPLAFSPDGKLLAASPESDKLWLFSTVTGRLCGELPGHAGGVECCAFSPDGSRLASGGTDQTVLLWDVSRLRPDRTPGPVDATRENAERLWGELGDDADRAYRAVAILASIPERSVPLLREHLKPVPKAAVDIEQGIKDLDSDDFAVRERARKALEKAGELARPALRRALAGQPSLELRRRAKELLDRVDAAALSPERVRLVRALAVLERIGSKEAGQVLRRLAEGAPEAFLTEEAKASVQRLRRRGLLRIP
jgi:WD40 repeat protein